MQKKRKKKISRDEWIGKAEKHIKAKLRDINLKTYSAG